LKKRSGGNECLRRGEATGPTKEYFHGGKTEEEKKRRETSARNPETKEGEKKELPSLGESESCL